MPEEEPQANPTTGASNLPPPEADATPDDVRTETTAVTPEEVDVRAQRPSTRSPGAPREERLSVDADDLGRRFLQDATQSPPTPGGVGAEGRPPPDDQPYPRPGEVHMREASPDPSEPVDRLVTHMPDRGGVTGRRARTPPEIRDYPHAPAQPEAQSFRSRLGSPMGQGALAGGLIALGFSLLGAALRARGD